MLIVYPPSSKSALYLPCSFDNKSAYLYASAVASSNVPLNSAVCLVPSAKIRLALIVTSSFGVSFPANLMFKVKPLSATSTVYSPLSFFNASAYLYASAVASSNFPLNSAVCLLPSAKIRLALIVTSSSGFFASAISLLISATILLTSPTVKALSSSADAFFMISSSSVSFNLFILASTIASNNAFASSTVALTPFSSVAASIFALK